MIKFIRGFPIFGSTFPVYGSTSGGGAPPTPDGLYFIEGYFDAIRLAGYMDI